MTAQGESKIIGLLEKILAVLEKLEVQGAPPVQVTPVTIVATPETTLDEDKIKQQVEKAQYWHMLRSNEGVAEREEAQQPDAKFMGEVIRQVAATPKGEAVKLDGVDRKCVNGECNCDK